MRPTISEFSYGYALTEAFRDLLGGFRAAPVFPSLLAEGKAGGGYDVKLGTALGITFLQFKLSECMKTKNALEARGGHLLPPFYRVHLRPSRYSEQHALLLDLENKNPGSVFYAAPMFHTETEFNDAYLGGEVFDKTVFVKPSAIGPLPDDKDHHLAVKPQGKTYFFSRTPTEVTEGVYIGREVGQAAMHALGPTPVTSERLQAFLDEAWDVLRTHEVLSAKAEGAFRRFTQERSPVEAVAYVAATYFECQTFLITKGPQDVAAEPFVNF